MTNFDYAKKLASSAAKILSEAERAFKDSDWNYTIRRAQESVELYLKSLLSALNTEFPKVHDIGKICIEKLEQKGVLIDENIKTKVIQISKILSEKRGPAFYWEEDYTEEEAEDALNSAKFIKEFYEDIIKRLGGQN